LLLLLLLVFLVLLEFKLVSSLTEEETEKSVLGFILELEDILILGIKEGILGIEEGILETGRFILGSESSAVGSGCSGGDDGSDCKVVVIDGNNDDDMVDDIRGLDIITVDVLFLSSSNFFSSPSSLLPSFFSIFVLLSFIK
jgi:hypothetical protein